MTRKMLDGVVSLLLKMIISYWYTSICPRHSSFSVCRQI